VIGGGPVGLSTALHLAAQGIGCVLVEKHATTATHPKASYFNVRTMEILRQLGIADDVYATGMLPAGVAFYTTLTGYKLGGFRLEDVQDHVERVMASTANPPCVSSQIVLEAILKQHVDRNPRIDVRFGHEKIDVRQDARGVVATVVERASGEQLRIVASYAIVCEGIRSSTREQCGRKMLGPPPFGHVINIYIDADLESVTGEKDQALFWISTPRAPGAFIGLGGDHRKWCFNTPYFPERGERPEDFDEARCMQVLRTAIGDDDLPIDILAVGPWVLCGQVIDEYRQGRILFGGDSAHSNIPTGGFGFNTGMQETHNLAWKLAAVLHGRAPEALLDTYHQERRPIAVFNVEKSRENAINIRDTGATFGGHTPNTDEIDLDTDRGCEQRAEKTAAIARQKTHFLFLGQEIGYGYWDSPLIVPDGSKHYAAEHDVDDPVYIYVPNARPGARAPHCWIAPADAPAERRPIHDLFGTAFVLLADAADGGPESTVAWENEVERRPSDIPLYIHHIGRSGSRADWIDVDGRWRSVYGVGQGGAVLVRPDGHVCWRVREGGPPSAATSLSDALEIAVGRRLVPADGEETDRSVAASGQGTEPTEVIP